MNYIDVIGAACSAGASTTGCEWAPEHLYRSDYIKQLMLPLVWKAIIFADHSYTGLKALPAIQDYCDSIAHLTAKAVNQGRQFITLGGDHSCAIGTWSGAASALASSGPLGLIWVDAHIDAHTPATSETGNIHGMPVAHLLGHGEASLQSIHNDRTKIQPEHLALIGIRSFEAGEQQLVESLGVKVYYIDEVLERGIDVVLPEAYEYVSANTAAVGYSIDLDGFDPNDAPGVGTPVSQGISAEAFIKAYQQLPKDNMLGVEIAEFNPELDIDQRSEQLVAQLIAASFDSTNA